MSSGSKSFVCLLCLIALAIRVQAVTDDTVPAPKIVDAANEPAKSGDGVYSSIWLRNVFDLKPIILAPPKDTAPPEPPPNVKLQGITTILGDKRAIFLVQESGGPGKPPAKEEGYILSEGQRQGSLEVLEIDPKARTVKIKVDELISTITFETNKVSGGGGPGNMAGSGVPRPPFAPGSGGFRPGGGFTPAPAQNGGSPAVPFRPVRTADNSQFSPQGGTGGGGYLGGYAQASAPAAGASIPGSLFNSGTPQQTQQNQPVNNLTPEEQVASMLAQHQAMINDYQSGKGPPPVPIPPMPAGTPSLGGSESSTTSENTGSTAFPSLPVPVIGAKTTGTFH